MNKENLTRHLEACLFKLVRRSNKIASLNDITKRVFTVDRTKTCTHKFVLDSINNRISTLIQKLNKLAANHNEQTATIIYSAIKREHGLLNACEDLILQDPPFIRWWEQKTNLN